MSEDACECPIKEPKAHEGTTSVCMAGGGDGLTCSRPLGHDGPHAACSPSQHPRRTWGGDDE